MKEYLITPNYTIQEVMDSFENNHDRNAFVINDVNKLIGVVSQGDIIKALASNISKYASVQVIMNTSFIYIKTYDLKKAYDIIRKKKITLIPVVNENMELDRVITLDDIFEYLENKA